jgi:putative ABC transport system permease protein
MLKNYLIIAWRSLLKSKLFSLINIVGLSLSMSVCLLIILLVYNHFQYDTFHPYGERTYRILTHKVGKKGSLFESGYATSPLMFRESLEGNYPGIESMTNLNHQLRGEIESESKVFQLERSLFADENFFEVFGFTLKEGNPETALTSPNALVLTKELAEKLFPKGDALGKLVTLEKVHSFTITGVLDELPGRSHIKLDALASFSSLEQLAADGFIEDDYDDWNNFWENYNYIVLSDPSQKGQIEEAINQLAKENIEVEDNHPGYEFSLQGVTEIVPGKILANEIGFALPGIVLIFFSLLGFVVMITASINYANLSVARTLGRVKEIGIRKSSGAGKWEIVQQFLVESIVMALLSLGFAVLFYHFLLQRFNEIWIFNMIGVQLDDDPFAYLFFVGFALILGLFTGIGPSLYASRMDVVLTLKGALGSIAKPARKRVSLKGIMTAVQFGLSILMLVSLFLLRDQAQFLTNADYGIQEDKVYYVSLQGHDPRQVYSEFAQVSGISEISMTSHHPAVGRSYGNGYRKTLDEEPKTIYHFSVDSAYISMMGLELIAGQNFGSESMNGTEKHVILNELAVDRMGLNTPSEAIGKWLFTDEDERVEVIGVLKNYHWEPMMMAISPMMLRVSPEHFQFAYLKIDSPQPGQVVESIKKSWVAYDDMREIESGFLSEEMDIFYQFMFDISSILTLIAVMAMSITGLGLMGMVSIHVQTHVKALGIHKVLGARFSDLFLVIARGFVWLIGIAAVISIPLAIMINKLWIDHMAQRAPISIFNVGPGAVILIGLSLIIILWQVITVQRKNPIHSLRSQ